MRRVVTGSQALGRTYLSPQRPTRAQAPSSQIGAEPSRAPPSRCSSSASPLADAALGASRMSTCAAPLGLATSASGCTEPTIALSCSPSPGARSFRRRKGRPSEPPDHRIQGGHEACRIPTVPNLLWRNGCQAPNAECPRRGGSSCRSRGGGLAWCATRGQTLMRGCTGWLPSPQDRVSS